MSDITGCGDMDVGRRALDLLPSRRPPASLALAGFNVSCEPAGHIELVLERGRIALTDSAPFDC